MPYEARRVFWLHAAFSPVPGHVASYCFVPKILPSSTHHRTSAGAPSRYMDEKALVGA